MEPRLESIHPVPDLFPAKNPLSKTPSSMPINIEINKNLLIVDSI
jgi:hypothetical protein